MGLVFLDSDICIHFLNGKDKAIVEKFKKYTPDEIKIAAIVKAELLFGVQNSHRRKENHLKLSQFLEPFEIVPFDSHAAEVYDEIRFELKNNGNIIGPNNLILASTVLTNEGTLATRNLGEFNRLESLKIEAW
ncbi:MAG: type II toxin-antitoxin system VapC family toxin [Leptospiraceae bacterium]|nr:type II toxin-antitoxin system VapC family toxin [Leptospiraceae bacterium]